MSTYAPGAIETYPKGINGLGQVSGSWFGAAQAAQLVAQVSQLATVKQLLATLQPQAKVSQVAMR